MICIILVLTCKPSDQTSLTVMSENHKTGLKIDSVSLYKDWTLENSYLFLFFILLGCFIGTLFLFFSFFLQVLMLLSFPCLYSHTSLKWTNTPELSDGTMSVSTKDVHRKQERHCCTDRLSDTSFATMWWQNSLSYHCKLIVVTLPCVQKSLMIVFWAWLAVQLPFETK